MFNCCFAATFNESLQDVRDKHTRCEWMDKHTQKNDNSSYHVHQQAPNRSGFQNEESSMTSKSQTVGDTIYHIYESAPKRSGFAN